MLSRPGLLALLTLALSALPASAGPLVYVLNGGGQFGTLDLVDGGFQQIGFAPEGVGALIPGPSGSLLTVSFSGTLYSIAPATGTFTRIGPTGLADCTDLSIPCALTSQGAVGQLGSTDYTIDFAQNLYHMDPLTGAAALIGSTGLPAVPSLVPNPDGSFPFFDENLFAAGGHLYATLDAAVFDPATLATTILIAPGLYQIDPSTGHATALAPTHLALSTVFNAGGTVYGFDGITGSVYTLDLSNGTTNFFGNGSTEFFDRGDVAGGLILGASPVVPEPASFALAAMGLAAVVVYRRRRGLV